MISESKFKAVKIYAKETYKKMSKNKLTNRQSTTLVHWLSRALIEATDFVDLSTLALSSVNTAVNIIVARPGEKTEIVGEIAPGNKRYVVDPDQVCDECLAELLYIKSLIDQALCYKEGDSALFEFEEKLINPTPRGPLNKKNPIIVKYYVRCMSQYDVL
jgi:hypothetical protein